MQLWPPAMVVVAPDVASAQGVSESMAMLNSRTWQRQLMSIGGLVDFLIR